MADSRACCVGSHGGAKHRAWTVRVAVISSIVLAGWSAVQLHAAMPPQYMSWLVFQRIAVTNEIPQMLFPHGSVERIERLSDGTYRVTAGNCFVPVIVDWQAAPALRPGDIPPPGSVPGLDLNVGKVQCN
jgi:hypothetical protein